MSLAWAAKQTLDLLAEGKRLLAEHPEAAPVVARLAEAEVALVEVQNSDLRSPISDPRPAHPVPASAADMAFRHEARAGLLYRPPGADANSREIAGFGERTNPAEFRELHGILQAQGDAAAGKRARELMVARALPLARWTGVAVFQAVLIGLVHHRGLEGARSVLRHLTSGVGTVEAAEERLRDLGAECGPAWVEARRAQERENEEWVWTVAKGKALPVPDWFREERAKQFGAGLANRWEDEGRRLAAAFVEDRRSESEDRRSESEDRRSESEDRRSESEDRRSESEDRRSESEDRRSESEDRRSESEDRRSESEDREEPEAVVRPAEGGRKLEAEAPEPIPLLQPALGAARKVLPRRAVRVAVVVGHYEADHGAHSAELGVGEWLWNGEVAEEMKRIAPIWLGLEVFRYRPVSKKYSARVAECYRRVNAAAEWDLCLELHYNASGGLASYTAMYVAGAGSARSVRLGEILAGQVSGALGTPNKGVIRRSRGERGGGALYACRAPMVLCEPFFGDHRASVRKVLERGGAKGLAWIYVDSLVRMAIAEGWAEVVAAP